MNRGYWVTFHKKHKVFSLPQGNAVFSPFGRSPDGIDGLADLLLVKTDDSPARVAVPVRVDKILQPPASNVNTLGTAAFARKHFPQAVRDVVFARSILSFQLVEADLGGAAQPERQRVVDLARTFPGRGAVGQADAHVAHLEHETVSIVAVGAAEVVATCGERSFLRTITVKPPTATGRPKHGETWTNVQRL